MLHANETLSTDRLIDELWGEHPPANAAKTVQMQISRLRKALAGEFGNRSAGIIVTREHGYELRLDPGRIDAYRFERLVAEGRGALAAGHPEQAALAFERALQLWRGAPMAELAYEPVAQPEIARLGDLRVAALEQLIGAKLALGHHAEVVGQLEALIAEHPYRERLRAQLMLALYRSDRQADALQAYQDARKTLVEELGIEPGERLRELERAILAQDPTLDLAAEVPAAEQAVETPRGAFVGRDAELAELLGGLDGALAGRGRLFLVAGEPGIGKSRLGEELIAHARARGALVLVGRCWEAGGAPAYWPWVQSLRAYMRQTDTTTLRSHLPAGAADLAQIVPELRQHFDDLPDLPSLESEGARFRLFDATAEFLRRASESRPIVLLLDDLHAADTPSLLLLQFVARELGSIRMLVVGAYRTADPIPGQPLTEMLVEVGREPVTRRLALGGLSEREVAEYVELTESEIASPELVAALHEDTEGNPLFVSEIVRLLSVEGVTAQSTAEVRLAIPQSLHDVIARRLTHLSEACNRVLILASVIGREFGLDALARVAAIAEDELLDVLDEAMTARVVTDLPGALGRLRFAHVLIRDTLYDGLTTARRVRLHRRTVQALEALYEDDLGPYLAELAHHSVAGRDFDKGCRYARRAGDRALALLAYEEGARLYETALEALDVARPTDERMRCELLLSLGEAQARAGDTPAGKLAFLDAAAIARRIGLPRQLAAAAAGYGGRLVWARAVDDDRLVPLLEESLTSLGEQDIELRARLLARLAGALRDEPSRDRRDQLSREAVELARRAENPAALAYALDGRAAAILGPDTVAECLDLGSELCRLADRIGDRERVVAGHLWRLIAQLQRGAVREAAVDVETMSRIADELRQPAQLWMAVAAKAMLAVGAGRLADAEELVTQALALGERAQPRFAINVYRVQRYTLSELRGCLEEVEPTIRDLVAEHPARTVFRCALAHLCAQLGRTEDAQRELADLARDEFSAVPVDLEWLLGMSLLAETSALLADRDSAPVLYRLLLPWATFNVADTPEWMRGSVSRYLGLLAATLERWGDAARHFEDALAANERMGARPWLAHTQNDYARTLLTRDGPGDRRRARGLLDAALTTYRALGMESYAQSAAGFVQRVGTIP